MPTYRDLLRFAHTGIASPDMTHFDKTRALAALGGGKTQTLTGIPPLSFKADGTPLISWSMKGNGQQSGTPTPDDPIQPEFVGTLSGADWTIPITCAAQTTPIYLGEVPTMRRIRKLVLTGEEEWIKSTRFAGSFYSAIIDNPGAGTNPNIYDAICSHAIHAKTFDIDNYTFGKFGFDKDRSPYYLNLFIGESNWTQSDFKSYLAAKYAAGTPVTFWYVLATPTEGITNEPLAKIGTYADELSSVDAGVSIPTAKGQNTLTVDGDLQPSEMTVTYRG